MYCLGLGTAIESDGKGSNDGTYDTDCEGNEVRIVLCYDLQKVLNFVVQYKYESTACTTKNVGERSLEEGATTF